MFPLEYQPPYKEYTKGWEPVVERLREGHVLSRNDLLSLLRENGGVGAVRRIIDAINSGVFSGATGIPLSVLAVTRSGNSVDVAPLRPNQDMSKPRLYMDSRFPVPESDLKEAALRTVTIDFIVSYRGQPLRRVRSP